MYFKKFTVYHYFQVQINNDSINIWHKTTQISRINSK